MVKSVGEDGLMDYNRSRKRSKSVNSSRPWKVMHEYFDAVDKCEEDDSRIRELEEEIQVLRARKNHNNCQRQILLDKVMGIDEIRVLDMADVDCLDKLCKLGFRGRILVEEELRLLQSAMDKIPLPYEICRDKKVDRISSLPDELLALILSSLPFKEAVATSTLSSRWRYLWTFITKLHFDGTSSMVKMAFGDRRLVVGYESRFDKARLNYVEWVNHVIALHKSPNLEEFRVFFDLTESYRNLIDEWLRFALTKKVQSLELNLTADLSFRHPLSNDNYTFDPYNLFSGSIDHVKYLKKIFLCWVNVSGEALAFLLCNCPLLEDLSLSKSNGLSTLKIVGPFPSFKRLEINSCCRLRSVEIRDVNLVYFKFVGSRPGHFVVKNLPLLVEMYIEGSIWDVGDVLWRFSKCLPQLEILTLDISSGLTLNIPLPLSDHSIILGSAVKMRNLKQLIIVTTMKDNGKPLMILITNLLRVLPSLQLQRFVLEATHPEFIEMETRNARTLIIVEKTTKRSYPQLKEIEFVGYRGAQCELELLVHFLDNAVALEKVVVDTRKPIKRLEKPYFATHKNKVNEVEVSARSRARKELSVIVPQKINLKIL